MYLHIHTVNPLSIDEIPFIGACWGLDGDVCAVYGTNHIREA